MRRTQERIIRGIVPARAQKGDRNGIARERLGAPWNAWGRSGEFGNALERSGAAFWDRRAGLQQQPPQVIFVRASDQQSTSEMGWAFV